MKIESLRYVSGSGWSAPFPDLDSDRTLVMVFGSRRFAEGREALRELAHAYPTSRLMGCSTSGEIFATELTDDSLSVAVARFEHASLRTATAEVDSAEGSFAAGLAVAEQLGAPDLRAVFVLSDGLNVNGSELVRGLNSGLPDSVIVTGGLAGDGDRFEETWVLSSSEPTSGRVVALGLYGDRLRIGHGSQGGWDIFGPERTVTRSVSNVLYELDGRPALQLYKEYLGERASGLPATGLLFPLALRAGAGADKVLVRTILGVNEEDQSMTFAGDIPEGSHVQLMRANFERLIHGASEAANSTHGEGLQAGVDTLAIAISCVGRRLILGERCEEEIEAALEVMPDGARMIGFYSYGEISPYASGQCDLHNQTMTLTTIAET